MREPRPIHSEEGEFNGAPTITLKWKPEHQYGFSFGVSKARLVLASLPQIEAFVAKHKDDPRPPRRQQGQPRQASGTRDPNYHREQQQAQGRQASYGQRG